LGNMSRSKLKKGTIAVGALAIIIALLVTLSCVAFLIMEYNSYMGGTKTANEVVSTKLHESLVVARSGSEIRVVNEGSMPSTVIGVYIENLDRDSVGYYKLDESVN